MIIALCGSIKFFDDIVKTQEKLKKMGHKVFVPAGIKGVDYWANDNKARVEVKKRLKLIDKYLDKIDQSDAILVVNITKKNIKNYIGANTFLEIGYAYHRKKKIFTLNPLPNQKYIIDELLTFESIVLNGNLELIK